ncbi:MAG: cupredoxin domain-containing protein [Syntrophobacteraceae bacterium]
MPPFSKRSLSVVFVMVAALAGCVGGGSVQTAAVRSGNLGVLSIEAGKFYFWPNEIRVDKPGPLSVQIRNVSGSGQNFTLEDPAWNILENIDLPAGKTTSINLELHEPGIYQFYCNKALHSFFGMNGQIYVDQK